MPLLDITGFSSGVSQFQSYKGAVQKYCPVTEQVLSGYIRNGQIIDDLSDRGAELQSFLKVYLDAGREKDSLGMRAPFVFWLVMCGWTSPQHVLSVMSGESAGTLAEEDLTRLFTDRWILESMLEHWDSAFFSGPCPVQREYPLSPTVVGPTHTKIVRGAQGRGLTTQTLPYIVDDFSAAAINWSRENHHMGEDVFSQLTNEPALPAMLARPQIFKPEPNGGFSGPGELVIVSQRWRDLVKHTFKALTDLNAGPVTARLVFEGITMGLCYFAQERKR